MAVQWIVSVRPIRRERWRGLPCPSRAGGLWPAGALPLAGDPPAAAVTTAIHLANPRAARIPRATRTDTNPAHSHPATIRRPLTISLTCSWRQR